ncbi:hypothetical protein ARAM_001121 [Aspergillus rambellii]|uniref:Glucosamine 6-phosphate N-acetyltransferase n=1 Tax=Aspergillus rambellii TaxID=308745 RepID=A0A0F8ULW5_9EURO|nr:hypothetical protein ARAM_001121 [Aspergillus rambellii]
MSSEQLFPPSLISSEVMASLPSGYTLRPLQRDDYTRGFLDCLSDLTWVGEYSEEDFYERYDWLATSGKDWYYSVVIDDGKQIVATATMIVERKLLTLLVSIHNRGMIGHIEEVVVAKDHQARGFGLKVIQALDSVAIGLGCYKTILDCGEHNVEFYKKCGYHPAGTEMSHYYEPFTTGYKRG